jgi:hypothetical protein
MTTLLLVATVVGPSLLDPDFLRVMFRRAEPTSSDFRLERIDLRFFFSFSSFLVILDLLNFGFPLGPEMARTPSPGGVVNFALSKEDDESHDNLW